MHGRFLFEALPDLFPERCLTGVECHLWGWYLTEQSARRER
jgi:hypothetical protein